MLVLGIVTVVLNSSKYNNFESFKSVHIEQVINKVKI